MGARGPIPNPHLRAIKGTRRPDRERRAGAIVGTGKAPSVPAWLKGEARKEFRRVAPQLAAAGLLAELDRTALALYCEALADYLEAAAIVQAEGLVVIGSEGSPVQHPAVRIRTDAWQRTLTAGKAFGMTPAARLRINPATPEKEKENPFKLLRADRPDTG